MNIIITNLYYDKYRYNIQGYSAPKNPHFFINIKLISLKWRHKKYFFLKFEIKLF